MEEELYFEPIDLIRILRRYGKSLKRFFLLPLALALAVGGLSYLLAWHSYTPCYQAEAVFSIRYSDASADVFSQKENYDNSGQLAEALSQLPQTQRMQDLVHARLPEADLVSAVTVEPMTKVNLFRITVRNTSPKAAYETLLAVLDCYPQAAEYLVGNPEVVFREDPVISSTPVNRFSGKAVLLTGGLAGLLLGLALIILHALLHKTIDSPANLMEVVNLPLFAALPHVVEPQRNLRRLPFITAEDDAALAEALRGLRIKLKKHLTENGGNIIVLTATLPDEGSSTIAANLALSLADEGNRVVLVDGALRSQAVFRLFGGSEQSGGTAQLLCDPAAPTADFIHPVAGTSLSYISGSSCQDRHLTVDSKQLRRVLDVLAEEFDYVVIDCPPCGLDSNATLLCRHAHCLAYVIREDVATESQILDAIADLHQRNIPLSGCIYNDVHPHPLRDRSDYGYGYGYEKSR